MAITKRFASENYVDTYVVEKATEIIENYEGSVKKAGDTMTGTLTAPRLEVTGTDKYYPSVSFIPFDSDNDRGRVTLDSENNRMFFKQFHSDQDGASTKYCENYYLPKTNEGRTDNIGYNILTTKEAVAIEQGGTGAKTSKDALTNLGAASATEFNEFKELVEGYDIPVSANNGVMNAIWDVVKSYLHHNNDLVYGHAYGHKLEDGSDDPESGGNAMHYEVGVQPLTLTRNVGTNENPVIVTKTGKCINCSTFVHLVLLGVPYEKSMYNPYYNDLRHNCINTVPYSFNLWGEDITEENYDKHMYTWNMAKRFEELGLGFKPNKNFSNLAPGDVVFFSAGKDFNDDLKNINHVGIVMAKHPGEFEEDKASTEKFREDERKVLYTFAEVMSGSKSVVTVRTVQMDSRRLVERGVCYIGRPTYSTMPDSKRLIGYKTGIARNVSFDVSELDLRAQDMVTLCFDYTPTSPEEYIQCYCLPDGFDENVEDNWVAIKRYTVNVSNNHTDIEHDIKNPITKRMSLPVRLSTHKTALFADDSTDKIISIRLNSIKHELIGNKTVAVATDGISNLSIWEGLNGDFITDKTFQGYYKEMSVPGNCYGACFVRSKGGCCKINKYAKPTEELIAKQTYVIATLPEELRPTSSKYFPIKIMVGTATNGTFVDAFVEISADTGEIKLTPYSNLPTDKSSIFEIEWFSNEWS